MYQPNNPLPVRWASKVRTRHPDHENDAYVEGLSRKGKRTHGHGQQRGDCWEEEVWGTKWSWKKIQWIKFLKKERENDAYETSRCVSFAPFLQMTTTLLRK